MHNRNFYFIPQYRIKRFVCDFVLPSQKIVVECDGDYWHANPKIYDREDFEKLDKIQQEKVSRDQIKDKYLRTNGWNIIRFFESDIKKDVIQCVDKIETKICWLAFQKAGDIWEEK